MAKPKTDKDTSSKSKKITDVARPNDTPPSETSKPVIITHRPLMRDPMMATPESEESTAPPPVKLPEPVETATPAAMKHERTLVPPSQAKESDETVSKMLTINSFKPQAATPAEPEKEAPAEEKKPEIKPEEKPEAKAEAPKPYTVTESAAKKEEPLSQEAQEAKDAEEEDERQKHLDKLIEDGTYFLPVDSVSHKKAKRNIIIGLVLAVVLGGLWLVAALDAGLIQIDGVAAPTDFFAN